MPADQSALGELRMTKEKIYLYVIIFILMGEDIDIQEEVFRDNFEADNTQEVAECLKPFWRHWTSIIESKSDERYNECNRVELFCFNVYRRSDDLCNDDDDTIPDSDEVANELVSILETWREKGYT